MSSTTSSNNGSSSSSSSSRSINLLSASQGARVVFATDEWFAAAPNLLSDHEPVFDPDAYCEQGKVMDGWETRRRRTPGHDWCLIALASRRDVTTRRALTSLVLDTAHFTGNHAPAVRVRAVRLPDPDADRAVPRGGGGRGARATDGEVAAAAAFCDDVGPWVDLTPSARTPLRPGVEETRRHEFVLSATLSERLDHAPTHARVDYFPDGGVARARLWATATATADDDDDDDDGLVDLARGGRGVGCSNQHYGVPGNLIKPHPGVDMGDGWETARHPYRPAVLELRDDGSGLVDFGTLRDWCVLKLGSPASTGVRRVVVDTHHFKGNFPESARVEGTHRADEDEDALLRRADDDDDDVHWFELLPRTRLGPDAAHDFDVSVLRNAEKPVTHVRVTIWPDGGLSRVRIYGERTKYPRTDNASIVRA